MQYLRDVSGKTVSWPILVVLLSGILPATTRGEDPRSAAEIKQAHQQQTDPLLKQLKSEPLTDDKAAAFEELAVVGSAEAIPILKELLADDKLSHYARFSLEPMPDPAVDRVFREALGQLEGQLLVGVVNSIGVRKDPEAVEALAKLLAADDVEVAAAAANSLGHIANQEAAKALTKALNDGPAEQRSSVALGAVVCAELMVEQDMTEQATLLFDHVCQADVAENIRLAGLRGAILSRGTDGLSLLTDHLGVDDSDIVDTVLRAARELPGPETTQALADQLDSLPATTKARVIRVLGDLGYATALPAVKAAAESDSMPVRVAAVTSLKDLGDVGVFPLLWKAAVHSNPELSQAAMATLTSLPGDQVDTAIVEKLNPEDAAQGATRCLVAVKLIGERRIDSATSQLRKVVTVAPDELKLAAIQALGETVSLSGISDLIDRVIVAREGTEKQVAQQALKAACVRMPDRDAVAKLVADRVPSAPNDVKDVLLQQLTAIGGQAALDRLIAGAKSSDPVVQDKATELLGKWVGSDIGPALLDLVKSLDNQKYRIRILRGYIRLARQFGLPPEETMTICRNALAVAERPREKKDVLNVLGQNPSPESLELAVSQLNDPQIAADAAQQAVSIAQQVVRTEPNAVVQPLQKLLEADVDAAVRRRAEAILKQATE